MTIQQPFLIETVSYDVDVLYSHYTDLTFYGGVLYATQRYDGRVEAWDVSGGNLYRFDSVAYGGSSVAGADLHLLPVSLDNEVVLISSGGDIHQLQYLSLLPDGSFGLRSDFGYMTDWQADIGDFAVFDLSDGESVIYGGLIGGGGLGGLLLNASGDVRDVSVVTGDGVSLNDVVVEVESVEVQGAEFLLSVSDSDHALSSWSVGAAGQLTQADVLDPSRGLWIADPTAMTVATVQGKAYAILGASGSNSLTVVEVDAIGALRVTDHLLDNAFTRFGKIQALASASYGELTYVVAGGGDGGLSVFLLGPDGHLYEQGSIADSDNASLANISAIEVVGSATGLDIYATSSLEFGVTHLRYDLGGGGNLIVAAPGAASVAGSSGADLIQGSDGDNLISGGAGTDLLIDGDGMDRLIGGSGSDTFVFVADDTHDIVMDFNPNEDRLDLSRWSLLHDVNQLEISGIVDGFRLSYGAETLDIFSEDWGNTTIFTLPDNLIIGVDRISIDPVSAPETSAPDTSPYLLYGTAEADELQAPDRSSILYGNDGDDVIIGSSSNDWLYGEDGDDLIVGSGGGDVIYGGGGNDVIYLDAALDLI